MYAIIRESGRQFKVEVGSEFQIDYREGLKKDDEIVFDDVLACRTDERQSQSDCLRCRSQRPQTQRSEIYPSCDLSQTQQSPSEVHHRQGDRHRSGRVILT